MDPVKVVEGGWGYVTIITFGVLMFGGGVQMNYMGMILRQFFSDVDTTDSILNYISSAQYASISVAAFLANVAFKRFSLRQVGMFGAVLYCLGNFLTIFVWTVPQIICSYGVLFGTGFGIMVNVAYTSVNQFFLRKRAGVITLTQACIGGCFICVPTAFKYCLQEFGYRGTLIVLNVMGCHSLISMWLVQPINCCTESKEEHIEKGIKLLPIKNEVYNETTMYVPEKQNDNQTIWGKMDDFLDLSLLKNVKFLVLAIGLTFSAFGDSTFFSLQPGYLYSNDFEQTKVANCLTFNNIGELLGKILLAIYCHYIKIDAQRAIYFGATLIVICRFVFLQWLDYTFMVSLSAVISALRCLIIVLTAIAFVDTFSSEKFPAVYGLYYLLSGMVTLTSGYFIGLLQGYTNSYVAVYHTINALEILFCILPWTIEMIVNKYRKR